MKVKDLIARLEELDQERNIHVLDCDGVLYDPHIVKIEKEARDGVFIDTNAKIGDYYIN